jgi:hypothetical protein
MAARSFFMNRSTPGQGQAIIYARQFIAGPGDPKPLESGIRHDFSPHLRIHVDSRLQVTRVTSGDCELLCLGSIIDPWRPEADNRTVLDSIAAVSRTFDDLEAATTAVGGRWLLFARIGRESRVYPDAAGLKSAFYYRSPDSLWLASQPGLLADVAGVSIDRALAARLHSADFADAWPGEKTPYPGVKPLLPNHYLDVDEGVSRRFWPRRPVEPCGTEQAAEVTAAMLEGTIKAVLARYTHAAIALTAGYESRCLLACARAARHRLSFFTIVDAQSPWYEYWTPLRLAWRFHIRYRHLWARRG